MPDRNSHRYRPGSRARFRGRPPVYQPDGSFDTESMNSYLAAGVAAGNAKRKAATQAKLRRPKPERTRLPAAEAWVEVVTAGPTETRILATVRPHTEAGDQLTGFHIRLSPQCSHSSPICWEMVAAELGPDFDVPVIMPR